MVAPQPTLAVSLSDLKHLFDATRNCRTHPVRQIVRVLVRSNVDLIERVYYRTVIRQRGISMSALPAEPLPVEPEFAAVPPMRRQMSIVRTQEGEVSAAPRRDSAQQRQDAAPQRQD